MSPFPPIPNRLPTTLISRVFWTFSVGLLLTWSKGRTPRRLGEDFMFQTLPTWMQTHPLRPHLHTSTHPHTQRTLALVAQRSHRTFLSAAAATMKDHICQKQKRQLCDVYGLCVLLLVCKYLSNGYLWRWPLHWCILPQGMMTCAEDTIEQIKNFQRMATKHHKLKAGACDSTWPFIDKGNIVYCWFLNIITLGM